MLGECKLKKNVLVVDGERTYDVSILTVDALTFLSNDNV